MHIPLSISQTATTNELKKRKIQTLHAYLERELNTLEDLKANSRGGDHRMDIQKAEQTINKVQHQLQIQYGEVSGGYLDSIESPRTKDYCVVL